MKYEETSGRSIDDAFKEFDSKNGHVYQQFKDMALKLIGSGKDRYSSKTLICVIRYFEDIKTEKLADGWKINDAFTSRYARKFLSEFPQHADFFELRELRS